MSIAEDVKFHRESVLGEENGSNRLTGVESMDAAVAWSSMWLESCKSNRGESSVGGETGSMKVSALNP